MKKLFSLLSVLCVAGLGVGLLAACNDEEEVPGDDGSVTEQDEGSTHEHSWGEGVVTVEPTCTEAGVMTYTCSCGETKTEPIAALGHDFSSIEYLVVDEGGEGTANGWYYVCSRCGEPGEALEEDADPFTNGAVVASTEAGLKAALSAVSSSKSEAVITLTSDMTIGEGVSGNTEFDISASNVTISGAEGVTITLNQEITVSGNNVTFTGLNLDGSSITNTSASASKEHVIYVTGSSFTITDSVIDSSVQAGILVEDASSSYDITISNCDINAPRAVYAFASSGSTGTINLTISGSHLEGTYPFNLTRYNGTISVTDSELVGWTSYSTGTNATFKGCTFSFSDRGDYAYGMLRAYGPTVLDHCYFVSYDGSGVSSTNYVAECHEDSANANNFVISTGNNAAIYTVIDCQFEDVTIVEDGDNIITVKDITSETVVSLIETENFQTSYSSSGFKFGSVEKVWTYSDLVPTTGGDEGGD